MIGRESSAAPGGVVMRDLPRLHGTTIVAVRRNELVAIAGDGQVTLGDQVMKHGASKVRRLASHDVIAGFAGSVSDALTLLEKFEAALDSNKGLLTRSAVEMVKEWRTDRVLRQLDAMLVVADREHLLVLSGTGEIVAPDDDIAAIGSGGALALAAARVLVRHTSLDAEVIAREALKAASEIDLYTNERMSVVTLGSPAGDQEQKQP